MAAATTRIEVVLLTFRHIQIPLLLNLNTATITIAAIVVIRIGCLVVLIELAIPFVPTIVALLLIAFEQFFRI